MPEWLKDITSDAATEEKTPDWLSDIVSDSPTPEVPESRYDPGQTPLGLRKTSTFQQFFGAEEPRGYYPVKGPEGEIAGYEAKGIPGITGAQALVRAGLYGVGTALAPVLPKSQLDLPTLEKALYEDLPAGQRAFATQWDTFSQWSARYLGVGTKRGQEFFHGVLRHGPGALASLVGLPGVVSATAGLPPERNQPPETLLGTIGEVVGDAAEYFGALKGTAKFLPATPAYVAGGLKGIVTPGNLANLTARSLQAATVSQLYNSGVPAKDFGVNAASYFAIMGASQPIALGLNKALDKVPVGNYLNRMVESGGWKKAAGKTLGFLASGGRHLAVDRADDWVQSVFDSAYYAWRLAPPDTPAVVAFLSALPSNYAMNYIQESVGDLPSMSQLKINGRLGKKIQAKEIERQVIRLKAEIEKATVQREAPVVAPEAAVAPETLQAAAPAVPSELVSQEAAKTETGLPEKLTDRAAAMLETANAAGKEVPTPTGTGAEGRVLLSDVRKALRKAGVSEKDIQAQEKRAEADSLKREAARLGEEEIPGKGIIVPPEAGVPEDIRRSVAGLDQTRLQLEVRTLGAKANRQTLVIAKEHREAVRQLRAIQREIKGTANYRTEEKQLQVGAERPLVDWLAKRQVAVHPGSSIFGEMRDALQGQGRAVKRLFHPMKAAEKIDGIRYVAADELATDAAAAGLVPGGTSDADFVRMLVADANRPSGPDFETVLSKAVEVEGNYGAEAGDRMLRYQKAYAEAASYLGDVEGRLKGRVAQDLAGVRGLNVNAQIQELEKQLDDVQFLHKEVVTAKQEAIERKIDLLLEQAQELDIAAVVEKEAGPLRQKVMSAAIARGFSKGKLKDIIREYAPKARGLSDIDDTGVLKKIVARIMVSRPDRFVSGPNKGKRVVRLLTESRIGTLQQNLQARGESTPQDFQAQMQELKLATYRFAAPNGGPTEGQALELLKLMHTDAPLIGYRTQLGGTLAANPEAAALYQDVQGRISQRRQAKEATGKKAGLPSELTDWRYKVGGMEEATGAPFQHWGQELTKQQAQVRWAIDGDFKRIEKAAGSKSEWAHIAKSRESQDRITQQIASTLPKVYSPPDAPKNITPAETRVAEVIKEILREQEGNVRWERFLSWRDSEKPIPDAPAADLLRANALYDTKGPDAAREFLDDKEWGVIRSGFEPWYVVKKAVIPYKATNSLPMPGSDIGVRLGEFAPEDRALINRLHSYLFRRYTYVYLRPSFQSFTRLWEKNMDKFENPRAVADGLGRDLGIFMGRPLAKTETSKGLMRLNSHCLLVVVALDIGKSVRNTGQTAAYYTDRFDLIDPRNRRLTPGEMQHYNMYSNAMGSLSRDYLLEESLPLNNKYVGAAYGLLRKYEPYKWSDAGPRLHSFQAALNRAERGLTKNPEDLQAAMKYARLYDLEAPQQAEGLAILTTEGPEAFKRYMATEVAANVGFLYERSQRANVEKGESGLLIYNLFVFPRSYIQRLALNIRKAVRPGSSPTERMRGLKTVISLMVGAWVVGEIQKRIFDWKVNPYSPLQVARWGLGGLALGAPNDILKTGQDIVPAMAGDRDAMTRIIAAIPRVAGLTLPLYDNIFDILEAATGTRNLDVKLVRQGREALDKRYKVERGRYKIYRTFGEKLNHALFGGADFAPQDMTEEAWLAAKRLKIPRNEWHRFEHTTPTGLTGKEDVTEYYRLTH